MYMSYLFLCTFVYIGGLLAVYLSKNVLARIRTAYM